MQARLRNLLLVVFLLLLFSLQFIGPNKYYFVEAIPKDEILEVFFSEGYFLGYGVSVENILVGIAIILVAREAFLKGRYSFFLQKKTLVLMVSMLVFFLCAFYSMAKFSPFYMLSAVWTMQYLQVFSIAIVVMYILNFYKIQAKMLLYTSLIWFSFFQSTVVILQFFKQEFIGLTFELGTGTSFYTGSDENNALFRPSGSFMYNNQASFILALTLSCVLPYAMQSKKKDAFIASIALTSAIILIQTRSIWIAVFCILCAIGYIYKENLTKLVQLIGIRRSLLYFLGTLAVFGPIVLPRLFLSANFFYRGAGLPIRVDMIKEAVYVIKDSFWFGYGPGTTEYITHTFFPEGVTSVFPAPVHNAYLHLMIEVGMLGLLSFFIPFLYVIRTAFNMKISREIMKRSPDLTAFMLGSFIMFLYYVFLSHSGTVEFAYLGIILGLGYSALTTLK